MEKGNAGFVSKLKAAGGTQEPWPSQPSPYPHAAIPEGYQLPAWLERAGSKLVENSQQDINLLQDEPDDNDDQEDDDTTDGEFRIGRFLLRIVKLAIGSWTSSVMMTILGIAMIVLCCVRSAREGAAPWAGMALVFGYFLLMLDALLLVRGILNTVIVRLLFPESRLLPTIASTIDPELWTLFWVLACWLSWLSLLRPAEGGSDLVRFKIIPSSVKGSAFTQEERTTILNMLIAYLLWAIRDIFVKGVMFKLMLGFLMNFSQEVSQFLHKYSQMRRLNAAWIRLVPSASNFCEMEPSLMYPREGSIALRDQLENIRNREVSKNRDMSKVQSDTSKQRLMLAAALTRSNSKTSPSRTSSKPDRLVVNPARTSFLTAREGQRDTGTTFADAEEGASVGGNRGELALKVEMDSPTPSPSFNLLKRRGLLGETATQKRARVREFHVETTGRCLPPHLERKNIQACTKSRLANMLAIGWIKEKPVVLFNDGQRVELNSKADARRLGTELFQTLLHFRQNVAELEHETQRHTDSPLEKVTISPPPQTPVEKDNSSVVSDESDAPAGTKTQASGINDIDVILVERHIADVKLEETAYHTAGLPVRGKRRASGSLSEGSAEKLPDKKASTTSWFGKFAKSPPLPKSGAYKQYTDAQLAAITAAEMRKVKMQMPDDKECLTSDFFELFMQPHDAKQLVEFLDPGNLGKITQKMFTRGIVGTYRLRKQIVHSLDAQEEIEHVFRRVCQYVMTFILLLAFLLILGVNPNTIIMTGASCLTAAGIVLSFLYTDFVQSIILLVFLNPYRIGDRVRIDGEAQYVKRITTYFTEFESLHGKPQYIAHKELMGKVLINESRCKNASSEINIMFSERTTPSQYAAFKKLLEAYLRSRPQEFIGDSLFVYIMGVAPSHFIQVSIWATHTDGWGNWMVIRTNESSLMHFIMRQATVLGMYYRLPIQRWEAHSVQQNAKAAARPPPISEGGNTQYLNACQQALDNPVAVETPSIAHFHI